MSMFRIIVIVGCSLTVVALLLLAGFWMYGPCYTVWKHLPAGRISRLQEILSDDSFVGTTKASVSSRLGPPDRVEGPYSWWSLLDKPDDGELSSMVFGYDECLNIVRVNLTESRSPKVSPLPLQLDTYRHASPVVRHRMHLTLETLSQQGKLPMELRTIHDVERYFPKARFVEHWYYYAGLSALVVAFDKNGKVDEVYEAW